MLSVVQKVFQQHFAAYNRAQRQPLHVRKAATAIETCRTPARGYHIRACPNGHVNEPVNNSCHHRACALCALNTIERWLKRQVSRLIDCNYYHVIFTVPHQIHILWQFNRKTFSTLLFQAAWHSLRELLADPNHLGALPGAIGSLHTWTQTLQTHVHAHFLVTAGGISADGQWLEPKGNILLPGRVLRAKFRGKFRAMLIEAIQQDKLKPPPDIRPQQCINLLNKLGRKQWSVRIQPRYPHGKGVLTYLARYIRGGPISPARIIRYERNTLTIRYKRCEIEPDGKGRKPVFSLSAHEFLERFVQHIPPTGLHTVRHHGLFHPAAKDLLAQARSIKGAFAPAQDDAVDPDPLPAYALCPVCRAPLVFITVINISPLSRAPPRMAA